ncbi:LysR substrate-binding domain-containing protein [Xanthobacter pseudotagetidis]|uniref:LysR substrate-binding domain-containing protein n=1 Tax=Xanthobacter pseudotagetidis TaxID=3119911 RepID=UPI003726C8DB
MHKVVRMSLKRVDLNLFRVFEAVMHSRSVSGASKDLGVTASAVSHALARLRLAVGDELFVYGDDGMVPTPRALAIAPAIREGLGRIEDAIAGKPFVPAEAVRTFRIAASEYGTSVVLTGLIARLAESAPQLELRIFPYSRLDVVQQLDEGRLDLVVGWFSDLPERVRRATLLKDQEALVVRRGHPLAGRPATREALFAYPFVVVELLGAGDQASDGFVDDRGVWRRVWIDRLVMEADDDVAAVAHVAVSLPHYASVADILARTDMVATLPARIARGLVEAGGHVTLELDLPPLEATVEAIWHQRGERDAGLQWLLGQLIEVTRSEAAP